MKVKPCNPQNYGGVRTKTAYIVVHYTGNHGDTAQNNAEYFARETVKASAHYFVDETEIWNSVPPDCIAWHCGAKSYRHPDCRNANSIGVEICMLDKNGALRKESVEQAASLVRRLMQTYAIPESRVLRHFDVTGKQCPAPMVAQDSLWAQFKQKLIEKEEENEVRYQTFEEIPDWAKPTISKLLQKGWLKGEGSGTLNLSEDVLKVLVINDRAGCYSA